MPRPIAVLRLLLLLAAAPAAGQDNVLLVVLDDVGVDRVRAYGEHPRPGRTPTLDALAAEGVRFRRCWANPYCSPTRATLLTGRYSFRTGIGQFVTDQVGSTGLDLAEWTLPEVLAAGSGGAYRTAAIGKWHLSSSSESLWHPMQSGFALQSGALDNLGDPGQDQVWWSFNKVIPGGTVHVARYATTDEVDDARRAIEAFGDEPWFVYLAFHAAHLPYHAPPPTLHDRALAGDPEDSKSEHHKAAVQAMDAELGRLLASIAPAVMARTTVVVVGDNGTQGPATEPPSNPAHGKGSLFEGGVRVPLIVAGAGVAAGARGRACDGLVNTTDLFATVAELCGVDARAVVPPDVALDSRSLVPYLTDPARPSDRRAVYAEVFKPNHPQGVYTVHDRAVRGPRYKLVRDELSGVDRLYDLAQDPHEQGDLLGGGQGLDAGAAQAYRELARWLEQVFRE